MSTKKAIHYLILIAIIATTYVFPAPEGLTNIGWHLAGIYIATIIAIILKAFPLPVILLAGVSLASIAIGIAPAEEWLDPKKNEMVKVALEEGEVLNGYKSGTTWLVFAAFAMSTAFVATGLGKRIAYLLIGAFGSTTLRLGYVNACLDLLISPAMPSVTARAGGIIFPIMNSVAVSLGSDPATSPRKAGHYLLLNTYVVVKATGYLFLTAMAPNALALSLIAEVYKSKDIAINVGWMQWFLAASVPGLLCLFLTPLVVYVLYPPELKQLDNKAIAKKGLDELGPMTMREKTLLGLFVLAVLSWALGERIGIEEASTTAISVMTLLVVCGVVAWEDLLKNKGAWNTLIWYGGLLGISSVLAKAKFFAWLSQFLGEKLAFLGTEHGTLATVVVLFMSVAVRYLFASGGAYIAAMVPVFSAVGIVAGADPTLLALGLLFSNCYGGALTHYGSGPAPIIYGAGYTDIKSWWIVGAVFAFGNLLIHVTIGFAWWKALVGMGVL